MQCEGKSLAKANQKKSFIAKAGATTQTVIVLDDKPRSKNTDAQTHTNMSKITEEINKKGGRESSSFKRIKINVESRREVQAHHQAGPTVINAAGETDSRMLKVTG